MTSEEIEILIHRVIGTWAIHYHVLMTSDALDAIEGRLQDIIEKILDDNDEDMEK